MGWVTCRLQQAVSSGNLYFQRVWGAEWTVNLSFSPGNMHLASVLGRAAPAAAVTGLDFALLLLCSLLCISMCCKSDIIERYDITRCYLPDSLFKAFILEPCREQRHYSVLTVKEMGSIVALASCYCITPNTQCVLQSWKTKQDKSTNYLFGFVVAHLLE